MRPIVDENANGTLHRRADALDSPDSIYNFTNPVGFYQRMQTLINLLKLLNRNDILLNKCARILDLGCGSGFMLRMIAELRCSIGGLVGIDLSGGRLCRARQINEGVKYIAADIRRLPFATGSFDLLTACVSFMFLTVGDDLRKATRETGRVLKSGGFFIFYDLLGRQNPAQGIRRFSTKEITRLLEDVGLRLIDKQACFKNIFGIKKLSTAYLSSRLPMELLLILERFPLSTSNNVFPLFRKK